MNSRPSVREVMNREFVGVSESDDLLDTVDVLLDEDEEAALVLRGSDPVGVLTERDVLTLLVEGPPPEEATVADAMSENPETISPEGTVDEAADRISARSTRRLVVTDGDEPLGIISEHDLIATRTYGGVPRHDEPEVETVGGGAEAPLTAEGSVESQNNYEDQGVCEACGTFTRDLALSNGQLLCSDCRSM